MYTMAITATALALPSSSLQWEAMETLLEPYGLLGELVGAGVGAAAFVAAIAILERKFLLECWKRFMS